MNIKTEQRRENKFKNDYFYEFERKKPEVLVRVSSTVGNHYKVQRVEDTAEKILGLLRELDRRNLEWNIEFVD